jgi:hypothetical protein
VNKSAPGGPTEAKVVVIKPGKLLKLVGKGLGDTPLDILGAGDPGMGGVQTAYCVTNGLEKNCHCSEFTACAFKLIAGGTGAKLVCQEGIGDGSCPAGCGLVDQGSTVLDNCTNLQWEKKDGADGMPGFGATDPGNPHDVDNRYSWAGECTLNPAVFCQPNAAAAATCATQTDAAFGCAECGPGEGTCDVDALGDSDPVELDPTITTVWDWLNQVNAESFAGHSDWRLATIAGSVSNPTGEPAELESIVNLSIPGCGVNPFTTPCIDPVFGPTVPFPDWSALTDSPIIFDLAWAIRFENGSVNSGEKRFGVWVRAVRPGS